MSRISYNECDDVYGLLAYGRWERNSVTTIKSKRGQKVLRDLEAALLAMPVKELVADDLWCDIRDPMALHIAEAWGVDTESVCILGAYARHQGALPRAEFEWLNGYMDEDGYLDQETNADDAADFFAAKFGMARTLAWNLMELNDEQLGHVSPPERYRRALRWVQERIRRE